MGGPGGIVPVFWTLGLTLLNWVGPCCEGWTECHSKYESRAHFTTHWQQMSFVIQDLKTKAVSTTVTVAGIRHSRYERHNFNYRQSGLKLFDF
jgi:hypothetical protein